MDYSFVFKMWLGIIVFPVSLCMIMSTSTFVSTIFYNYKKQTFGRDLLVRPKKKYFAAERHCMFWLTLFVLFHFQFLTKRKNEKKASGFFSVLSKLTLYPCLSSPSWKVCSMPNSGIWKTLVSVCVYLSPIWFFSVE